MLSLDILNSSGVLVLGIGIGVTELVCGVGYTLLLPPILLLLGFDPVTVIFTTTATQVVFSFLQRMYAKTNTNTFKQFISIPIFLPSAMAALAGVLLLPYIPTGAHILLMVCASLIFGIILMRDSLQELTFTSALLGTTVYSFMTGLTGIGVASWGQGRAVTNEVDAALRTAIVNSQLLTCAVVAIACIGYPQINVRLSLLCVFSAILALLFRQVIVFPVFKKYNACVGVLVIIISLLTLLNTLL